MLDVASRLSSQICLRLVLKTPRATRNDGSPCCHVRGRRTLARPLASPPFHTGGTLKAPLLYTLRKWRPGAPQKVANRSGPEHWVDRMTPHYARWGPHLLPCTLGRRHRRDKKRRSLGGGRHHHRTPRTGCGVGDRRWCVFRRRVCRQRVRIGRWRRHRVPISGGDGGSLSSGSAATGGGGRVGRLITARAVVILHTYTAVRTRYG